MKKLIIPGLLILFTGILFQSCKRDQCKETITYEGFEPIYMDYEMFRQSVKQQPSQSMETPGKIYFKGDKIYINEFKKGIHVIDNSVPANPKMESFIQIPGNVDMAISGNYLYADSYIDLVVLDISDPENVQEVSRDEEVFPYTVEHYYHAVDPTKGVIVDWKEATITEELDCSGYRNHNDGVVFLSDAQSFSPAAFSSEAGGNARGASSSEGQSGSMARFNVVNDYLYTVSNTNLMVFNIMNEAQPSMVNEMEIGQGVETLFPYKDKLFFGTQNGMLIYDITNPSAPNYISEFTHARACDPVVVKDDYAYVTLRNGNECWTAQNMLNVVDISNIQTPQLLVEMPMFNPHGLGANSDDKLFICDGSDGLKVYDITDPLNIENSLVNHFNDLSTYDVIPNGNLIMVIGPDGLYQYSYDEAYNLTLLSVIPVTVE